MLTVQLTSVLFAIECVSAVIESVSAADLIYTRPSAGNLPSAGKLSPVVSDSKPVPGTDDGKREASISFPVLLSEEGMRDARAFPGVSFTSDGKV